MLPNATNGWIIGLDFASGNKLLRYTNEICRSVPQVVYGPPTLSQTGTVNLCPGSTITLQANGCTGNLMWSTGATTSSIIVQSAGTYSATCGTSCGISQPSQSLTVTLIPTTQTLSGTATSSVQRAGAITSTQHVPNGTTATYSAVNSVTLSPAFQADNGSVFVAKIEGCN